MQTNLQSAIIAPPSAGADWSVLGTALTCKVSSEETGGAYSIVEQTVEPQSGPPPHVHQDEDEIFYIADGEFEILCGEQTYNAAKGFLAVLPRGIPHTFRNVGATAGTMLVTITPGGFEKFFAEVSREIKTMPPDIEKVRAIGRKFNLEFFV